MDGNGFRVVLRVATAVIGLAITSIPVNAQSRQYMIEAMEDHVNRVYEMADEIHAEFRRQQDDPAGDDESSHSSSSDDDDGGGVHEVVVSDQASDEANMVNGIAGNDGGTSDSMPDAVTAIEDNNAIQDGDNGNSEPHAALEAMRANYFVFENYDDTDDEGDDEDSQADTVIKSESPSYEVTDLMNQETDDIKEHETTNGAVESGTIVEEQLAAGPALETRTNIEAEQSQPSNPKRKRAADNSSDSNAGKLSRAVDSLTAEDVLTTIQTTKHPDHPLHRARKHDFPDGRP